MAGCALRIRHSPCSETHTRWRCQIPAASAPPPHAPGAPAASDRRCVGGSPAVARAARHRCCSSLLRSWRAAPRLPLRPQGHTAEPAGLGVPQLPPSSDQELRSGAHLGVVQALTHRLQLRQLGQDVGRHSDRVNPGSVLAVSSVVRGCSCHRRLTAAVPIAPSCQYKCNLRQREASAGQFSALESRRTICFQSPVFCCYCRNQNQADNLPVSGHRP